MFNDFWVIGALPETKKKVMISHTIKIGQKGYVIATGISGTTTAGTN